MDRNDRIYIHLLPFKIMAANSRNPRKAKKTISVDPSVDVLTRYGHANKEITFLGLNYKSVTISGGEWYNLESSRRIKKLANRIYLIKPRVTGPVDLLIQFMMVNNLDITDVTCMDAELPILLQSKKSSQEPRIIRCKHIDDVPIGEAELLQPFSFSDLVLEAIVTNIIDGDTMDCMAMVDPYELAMPCTMRCGSKTVIGQRATVCSSSPFTDSRSDTKILMSFRIRLFGIDAADCAKKDAPEDVQVTMRNKKNAATEFVRRWCKESGNRIWLHYMGFDCRSRTMGALYQRGVDGSKSKTDLTTKLLKFRHPIHGKVAVPYEGGNKKDAWMN